MKLKLPRRRWLVLAGFIAVVGCGLALLFVEEAQRRYERMVASYERVRMGMTRLEVRSAVGQQPVSIYGRTWAEACERFDHWDYVATDGNHRVQASGEKMTMNVWMDHDLMLFVRYADGKALDKSLVKTIPDWRLIARNWFDRLRRLFS
jgi:hypothetical protein